MKKFLLFLISIAVSTSSISANKGNYCMQDTSGDFHICGYSDVITFVNQTENSDSFELALNVKDFSAIAPYTFRKLARVSLEFFHPDKKNCIPKYIELTPESFEGLSVRGLDLQCVKFAIKPNPFKKLESLTTLWLKRVEIMGFLQEFCADLPHVNWLKLSDLNITIVSPNVFSGINEELRTLEVYDRLSSVEPTSFARFHKLNSLTLNGGQLADLRSDMFDGLNYLEYLNLANNKITVLRSHTFGKLYQLAHLYLSHNRISKIESETFSGLNFHTLDLQFNNLEILPVGVFHNLKYLAVLNLEYNKLRTVRYNVFKGCTQLSSLRLSNNEIYRIAPNAFEDLNLYSLDFSHNNLTILRHDLFSGLHVQFLDLRFNNISKIKPRAFRNLTARRVRLCYHNMTEVHRDSWGLDHSITSISINDC